ncbi:MAG TPA: MinD/ParA family protein, partial [Mycobacterium sp.]|nr:MinD/ParA family protein [Mycobacterium sp.]
MTNPWNPAPNSPDQARQTPRPPTGSRPQHPDSVSETLRISDMVTPRKIPPGSGWRKFLYSASFQTINLGESPAEPHYRELQGRIRRHIRK